LSLAPAGVGDVAPPEELTGETVCLVDCGRLRFEAENEDSVEIVVKPREKENGRNEHRG
jgi:hypothetical protein